VITSVRAACTTLRVVTTTTDAPTIASEMTRKTMFLASVIQSESHQDSRSGGSGTVSIQPLSRFISWSMEPMSPSL